MVIIVSSHFGILFTLSALIILELQKDAKRLKCSSDFMDKIEERSNAAFFQPPISF